MWQPEDDKPVLLVAGGSGVVPLMAMIRSRDGVNPAPFRLIYSVRTPEDQIYDRELRRRAGEDGGLGVTVLYTRTAPEGVHRPVGRISADDLVSHGWPADVEPRCFVWGRHRLSRPSRICWSSRDMTGQDQDRAVRAKWPMTRWQ